MSQKKPVAYVPSGVMGIGASDMNKEVCIRCINKAHESDPNIKLWQDIDDKYWEEDGFVLCPIRYVGGSWGIVSELPPKGCPYALEHLVIE